MTTQTSPPPASSLEDSPALNFVQDCPAFEGLSPAAQNEIAAIAEVVPFGRGQKVIAHGERGDSIFFLVSGQLDFLSRDSIGHKVHYSAASPGEVFGEIACFSDGRRTADVVAASDGYALRFGKENVSRLFAAAPAIAERILGAMAERLRERDEDLRQNTVSDFQNAVETKKTDFDRQRERMVGFLISPSFLWWNGGVAFFWIVLNIYLGHFGRWRPFDPFPYELFGLGLGIEALVVSTLVLYHQDKEQQAHRIAETLTDKSVQNAQQRLHEIEARLNEAIGLIRSQEKK